MSQKQPGSVIPKANLCAVLFGMALVRQGWDEDDAAEATRQALEQAESNGAETMKVSSTRRNAPSQLPVPA